jgi:hypothetical protein
MNLFRSEGHIRKWSGFKPGTEEGIVEMCGKLKRMQDTAMLPEKYFAQKVAICKPFMKQFR